MTPFEILAVVGVGLYILVGLYGRIWRLIEWRRARARVADRVHQAAAKQDRDLLAALDRAGVEIVLQIHDEIIVVDPENGVHDPLPRSRIEKL